MRKKEYVKRTCVYCHQRFNAEVKQHIRITCSKKCFVAYAADKHRVEKIKLKCDICSTEILLLPSQVLNHRSGKFGCSPKCKKVIYQKYTLPHLKQNQRKRRTCKQCKKHFYGKPRKMCSRTCLFAFRKAIALRDAKWRRKTIKKQCPGCKKMFECQASWRYTCCSRKCFYATKISPNKSEVALLDLVKPLGFKYVGNWELVIGGRNPDFVHKSLPLLIEFFGEYWHDKTDISRKRYHFGKHGYRCLIIWGKQLQKSPARVVARVKNFISKAA